MGTVRVQDFLELYAAHGNSETAWRHAPRLSYLCDTETLQLPMVALLCLNNIFVHLYCVLSWVTVLFLRVIDRVCRSASPRYCVVRTWRCGLLE